MERVKIETMLKEIFKRERAGGVPYLWAKKIARKEVIRRLIDSGMTNADAVYEIYKIEKNMVDPEK